MHTCSLLLPYITQQLYDYLQGVITKVHVKSVFIIAGIAILGELANLEDEILYVR